MNRSEYEIDLTGNCPEGPQGLEGEFPFFMTTDSGTDPNPQ